MGEAWSYVVTPALTVHETRHAAVGDAAVRNREVGWLVEHEVRATTADELTIILDALATAPRITAAAGWGDRDE